VSQRIAALERDLGAPLIDRSSRRFRLTLGGERAIKQAERLLALEKELRQTMRANAPLAGRVRVGVIESVVHTWLTDLIRELARRYPDIQPDLTVETSRNLREQFQQRKLDLIIQNNPVEAAGELVTAAPLCRYPMGWVAKPGLLPRRRLKLDDLARVPLLTFSRNSTQHVQICALFAGRENEPRVNTFPSVAAILRLTMEGFGLAVIPLVFVKGELLRGKLVAYTGPKLPEMTINVAHSWTAEPAVVAIAHLAREVADDYGEAMGRRWVALLRGA
jgi:DNA-binding transcriptional LysR family regulator